MRERDGRDVQRAPWRPRIEDVESGVDVAVILGMLRRGSSLRQVAARYGIGKSTVARIRDRYSDG